MPPRSRAKTVRWTSCAALCAALWACIDAGGGSASDPSATNSAESSAFPVLAWETANPSRADSSDLEPLVRSFRGVRIALLGEAHLDGASHALKTRLLRALHDRLGFRVVAFESLCFDVWQLRRRWARLRDADELCASPGAGGLWSRAETCRPFYAHLLETRGSAAPWEVFGLDCKFGEGYRDPRLRAEAIDEDLGQYLRRICGALDDADGALARAVERVERTVERQSRSEAATDAETRRADADALDVLGRAFAAGRARSTSAHGALEASFSELVVRGLRAHSAWCETFAADLPGASFTNPRDAFMAEALQWYLDVVDPQAKIVVWTGGFHGLAAPEGLELRNGGVGAGGVFEKTVPLAELLRARFGDEVRIVGCTSWHGATGMPAPKNHFAYPPPDDSIEADLAAAGARVGSIDFRGLPPDHPWRSPKWSLTYGHAAARGVWPRHLDVLLYARTTFAYGANRDEGPPIDRIVGETPQAETADVAAADEADLPLLVDALRPAAAAATGPVRELDGRWPRFEIAAPRLAVVEPLSTVLETSGPVAVELRRGLAAVASLQLTGPSLLTVEGDCDGDLHASGPLAAVVKGAFGGAACARGPSVWRFDGPFAGTLVLHTAALVDLRRNVDRNSDAVVLARAPGVVVRVAGRTAADRLDRFRGAMRVELETSDLPVGVTRVRELEVVTLRQMQ